MKRNEKNGMHGSRAATRTAWILGGITLAIYAGALVLGHVGGLNASWEPRPAAQSTGVHARESAAGPQIQQVAAAPVSAVVRAPGPPSRP